MIDPESQYDEIIGLFGRLGIEIRMERLGGQGGGLCTVRGTRVVFVDTDADVATRVERCLAALGGIQEVESLYLPPSLREQVDRRREWPA